MIIVDSEYEFSEFKVKIQGYPVLVLPIYSDIYKHSSKNRISFLYICSIDKSEYILSFHHNDLIKCNKTLDEIFNPNKELFIYQKNRFLYHFKNSKMNDVDLMNYFKTNSHINTDEYDSPAHNFLIQRLNKFNNINDVIPFSKHLEVCRRLKDKFFELYENWSISKSYEYYNDLVIGVLFNIEKNGLFVDYNKFIETFGQNGLERNLTFSYYNIYTKTGRPSNRYSGINYAALNKEDGTRKAFISRFEKNGMLVNFDYNSYHLRLIAELVGYVFPKNINIHEYLGKQYFNTDKLSEEQYQESKQISFRQLYGGVESKYEHIPYFQSVKKLIEDLWWEFKKNNYIVTKLFGRELRKEFFEDLTRNKLFNYYLQNLETERNITILYELIQYYKKVKAKSKIVLYTYDSEMIDFNIEDGKELIIETKKILEQDGKFPVKIEIGSDYHNMKPNKRLSIA